MRKVLVNLSVSLLALALALGACEVVVRTFYADETVLFPRYHTDYRYGPYTIRGIRPNAAFRHTSADGSWAFTTNSRGLRSSVDFAYGKPAGTFRVLSLGDSHTQGYEVAQDATFSAVLERHLRHRGAAAEVLNAGVSGFSTAEALVFLEHEGYRYRPDAVVLGFYANDFEDNLKAGLFGLDAAGALEQRRYEHVPGVRIQNVIYSLAPVRWLSENSYFYSLFFNTTWNFAKIALRERALREAAAGEAPGPGSGDDFEYAVPTAAGPAPQQVALAAALIERMHRFCRERGVRFILVDIPVRTAPYRHASSLPPPLLERLRAAGVEAIVADEIFAALDGAAALHVPNGHRHISPLAHTLIGAALGERLRPR